MNVRFVLAVLLGGLTTFLNSCTPDDNSPGIEISLGQARIEGDVNIDLSVTVRILSSGSGSAVLQNGGFILSDVIGVYNRSSRRLN